MTDFELQCKQIKDEGRCLMEYIRGSHLYNLNTPQSDLDTGGIYIATDAEVLGILNYKPQISDEKHDNTWYEIGKFIELLMKSNPTVMEALFAPDNKIIGEVHPIMKELRDKRNLLLTKDCFNPFYGYAKSQIEKARGLNKKIVNPVKEKKGPLDFTYTFYNQGSTKIKNWLEYRGLNAKYCGLVNIPNMHEIYGLYYDFGNHILHEENWRNNEALLKYVITLINSDITYDNIDIIEPIEYGYAIEWLEKQEPIGYRGLIDFENETSFLRLSSVPDKHAKPICHISYNMDGYKKHCKEYKEYKEWEKMRNPVRYQSNLNKTYDCYLDEETEFLTNHGWKKYDDITSEDLLGCFSDKHVLEYKPFISRVSDIYTGDIYTFENAYTYFSITPNHKLYVSRCHRGQKGNYKTLYDKDKSHWELLPVKDYFAGKYSTYNIVKHLNNNNPDNTEYSDDELRILGYYISEGCFEYNENKTNIINIRIGTLENTLLDKKLLEIKDIPIKRYAYNTRGRVEITYTINSRKCIDMCKNNIFIHAQDKALPDFVNTLSKRQVDILYEALLIGDGIYNKKGHVVYYTSSKTLAIQLFTLLRLNGYNTQLYGGNDNYLQKNGYTRKDNKILPKYQVFISKINNQYDTINKRILKKHSGWKKTYVEKKRIVCFETTYGTLITKNHNKIAFQGNSKNLCHCFRLMHMAKEILRDGEFILERTWDHDFLMDVRNHKFEYEELIDKLEQEKTEMEEIYQNSKLPEHIDPNVLNEILINIRKMQLKIK